MRMAPASAGAFPAVLSDPRLGLTAADRLSPAGLPASRDPSVPPGAGAALPGVAAKAAAGGLPEASGASGCDSTRVGASGALRAISGLASRFSATTTVTLSRPGSGLPSGPVARRAISLVPGGRSGGVRANWPEASARAVAKGLPSRRSSMRLSGAARPAMTLAPSGSTRTMSKLGVPSSARGVASGAAGCPGPVPPCERAPRAA